MSSGAGDKLTVTVERADGGKLRCTGASWDEMPFGGPPDEGDRQPPISVRMI